MRPELLTLLVAAASTGVVGALGVGLVVLVARRSVPVASWLTPLVAVAAVAAGVVVSAQAMFLSDHDLIAVWLVIAASVPIALAIGLLLARRVLQLQRLAAAEAAARAADAEVEASRREMVAWVSHDLRTPLAAIRAMAESLEDGVASQPGRYHAKIRHEADRLAGMVDDLLVLSRIQSGALRPARQVVALTDLVSDSVAAAMPMADEADVRVRGRADPAVRVDADPAQLSRAVLNLVVNAVRHTRPGGVVEVTVARHGDSAVVAVQDECGGIAADDLTRVFDPGWRGSGARTPAEGAGAGLGLAIVRGVVDVHGGRVDVANVDGGCCFRVRLPVA